MKRISKLFNIRSNILALGLLLLIFSHPISLQAQVCENVELLSQNDVDDFNCISVTRNLLISGSDITNLEKLSGLTSVGILNGTLGFLPAMISYRIMPIA